MRSALLLSALLLAACMQQGDVFRVFQASEYLAPLWEQTCVYPLTRDNLILIAHVQNTGETPSLTCDWHRSPSGTDPSVGSIRFPEEVSDIDQRWYGCSTNRALPSLVWDAVRHPGSNLVHLGDGLRSSATEAYVLVAKCHYWTDNYCDGSDPNPHCSLPQREEILSVAYAVYDPQTGEIHW